MRAVHAARVASLLGLAATLAAACTDEPTGPTTGAITVIVSTSGEGYDPDGYRVSVDGGSARPVTDDAPANIPGLGRGAHLVLLQGVDANCTVSGPNPRQVTVNRGAASIVAFQVVCVARTGTLRVTATTTGAEPDVDGYSVSIDDGPARAIASSGTLTVPGVLEGEHSVTLGGWAGNCTLVGPNPRPVTVPFGGTGDVGFAVECEAGGSLAVTTATGGISPDLNGYSVTLERPGFSATGVVAANGTVTFPTLRPGDYRLVLGEVAANCDIAGENPITVTVARGNAASAAFDVACAPPTQVAFVRVNDGNADIYVINSDATNPVRLTTDPARDGEPAWSPDGSKIAFSRDVDGDRDIYVMNANGTNQVRLTTSAASDYTPAWSPDGSRIAFVSERDENPEIYVMNADGSNPTRLTNNEALDAEPAWSPDGGRIAFRSDRDGDPEIYAVNPDGSGLLQLTSDAAADRHPAWSPDGGRIAFARGACDYYYGCYLGIYVMNADGSGDAAVTSAPNAEAEPTWSPDGRKLAFTVCDEPGYGYYDNCSPSSVRVVRMDGAPPVVLTNGQASNPAWRP